MDFVCYELPSGVRCILKRVKSPVVYCSLTVGTGSRDEEAHEHGMAHLIEHLMFKGTTKRSTYHINALLDNVGGEINAYTTKEETVIHTVTLKQDLRRAIDLICDVTFNSQYEQREMDKEVKVIVDEINSYKDSPSEQIYDDFEDLIFSGSQMGHSILGEKKRLKKYKSADAHNFVRGKYDTNNMVFAIIGDVTPARFRQLCDTFLGAVSTSSISRARVCPPINEAQHVVLKKNTYQSHCILGARAYKGANSRRVATALAINILGGPSAMSRLNNSLREKHALTYNVEANYTAYSDCGLVTIYFSCDTDELTEARRLVDEEIKLMQTVELSPQKLRTAKKQLIGQLTINSESSEGYMLSCAKSYLMFGEVDSPSKINKAIESVTAEEIKEVMTEIFKKDNISSLTYI